MRDYDLKDQVTFYFIILNNGKNNDIRAWTDDKNSAEFYLKFHNCKKHELKKITKTYKSIIPILNENINNRIEIMNILSAEKKGNKKRVITVQVPMTRDELGLINDTTDTFCSNMIDYSSISEYMHKFKHKYQKAIVNIGLPDVIDHEVYNNINEFTKSIDLDQLKLLFKLLPDDFD